MTEPKRCPECDSPGPCQYNATYCPNHFHYQPSNEGKGEDDTLPIPTPTYEQYTVRRVADPAEGERQGEKARRESVFLGAFTPEEARIALDRLEFIAQTQPHLRYLRDRFRQALAAPSRQPGEETRALREAELVALIDFRDALNTIRGPEDSGPWIEIYRGAGGGYAGLQAIAEYALTKHSALSTPQTAGGEGSDG